MSADEQNWFLLNVSPDVHAQIERFPALHPARGRGSPIVGAVFTNGDLDACMGLFCLREAHPLALYATEIVRRGLTDHNAIYRTLERFASQVVWHALSFDQATEIVDQRGRQSGLDVQAVPVIGKVPIHLEGIVAPGAGQNIGLLLRSTQSDAVLGFFPSVAGLSRELEEAVRRTTCCFFDGTFWTNHELAEVSGSASTASRSARDMAHWPLDGPAGSLAWLPQATRGRRILIHVNNTNPILNEKSPERRAVMRADVEVAVDGMEFVL